MVVLDGYKNHFLIQFEEFYKKKNIITLCFPAHSSHLTQPFNVRCFNVLKRSYSRQFETFIKIYINYIIKTEFFIAFKAVHLIIMIISNIQRGFRNTSLILYDLQAILSKFDIKLRTPISINLPFLDVDL